MIIYKERYCSIFKWICNGVRRISWNDKVLVFFERYCLCFKVYVEAAMLTKYKFVSVVMYMKVSALVWINSHPGR